MLYALCVGQLLKREPFERFEWTARNPPGFSYRYEDGENPIRFGDMVRGGGASLRERGFLRSYGTTTFEHDFCSYVRTLFSQPERLEVLAARYPRVRRKRDVCVRYLRSTGYFRDRGKAKETG